MLEFSSMVLSAPSLYHQCTPCLFTKYAPNVGGDSLTR